MSDKNDPKNALEELHQLLGQSTRTNKNDNSTSQNASKPNQPSDITINRALLNINKPSGKADKPAVKPQISKKTKLPKPEEHRDVTINRALLDINTSSSKTPEEKTLPLNTRPSNDTRIDSMLSEQIKSEIKARSEKAPHIQSAENEPSLTELLNNPNLLKGREKPRTRANIEAYQQSSESIKQVKDDIQYAKQHAVDDVIPFQWEKLRYPALFLGILVIFGSIFLWIGSQEKHLNSQHVLYKLAKDAKHFQDQYNFLPGTLEEFENFPEDAIEWPIEYWEARNEEGRPEIIWLPYENGRFTIILRYEGRVWYYDSIINKVHEQSSP